MTSRFMFMEPGTSICEDGKHSVVHVTVAGCLLVCIYFFSRKKKQKRVLVVLVSLIHVYVQILRPAAEISMFHQPSVALL